MLNCRDYNYRKSAKVKGCATEERIKGVYWLIYVWQVFEFELDTFMALFDFELDTSIFWLSPTSPPPPPPKIIFCLLHCLFVKCGHFCINCKYWCKIVDVSVCKRILSHVWILMIICVTWFSVGLASNFFFQLFNLFVCV